MICDFFRQRAEIRERIAFESLQKICTNFFQVAGHAWVELKQSHKPLTQGMFRSLILVHKAEERKIAGRINSYKLTETNS